MLLIGTLSVCDMLKMFLKNYQKKWTVISNEGTAVNGAYQVISRQQRHDSSLFPREPRRESHVRGHAAIFRTLLTWNDGWTNIPWRLDIRVLVTQK